jgi:hypothetical protein
MTHKELKMVIKSLTVQISVWYFELVEEKYVNSLLENFLRSRTLLLTSR